MKLKLDKQDLTLFLNVLEGIELPSDALLSRISDYLLADFILKYKRKLLTGSNNVQMVIEPPMMLVLNALLGGLRPADPYNQHLVSQIYTEINRACLNI